MFVNVMKLKIHRMFFRNRTLNYDLKTFKNIVNNILYVFVIMFSKNSLKIMNILINY